MPKPMMKTARQAMTALSNWTIARSLRGIRIRGRRDEDRLACDPRPRIQRLLERGMPQHVEPDALKNLHAPFPEELLPAKAAHQSDELRVVALHDRAAFVEQGQQIAPAAAPAALARNLVGVQRIDQRLGPGKGEPGERVEEIVQVVRPRLDPAGFEEMHLVVRVGRSGRHEPHRVAARRADIQLARKMIQTLERALGPQALEPGANRVEDRMR